MTRCRAQPGCLDVSSPDPIEAGRVNLFEHWSSAEALTTWRAVADAPSTDIETTDADVSKHEVSHSGPPFD